jgi:hypothetical protein
MASKTTILLKKKSPFQLKILGLYAQFVRLSKNQPGLLNRIRAEFRQAAALNPKTDSLLIDYKIRRANNQLEMLKTSNVKAVKTVDLK